MSAIRTYSFALSRPIGLRQITLHDSGTPLTLMEQAGVLISNVSK